MSATDGLLPPTKKTKKYLLFLPPDEWHEIGLLFANYIIRSKGFETIYLGQNVPIENIESIVGSVYPKYVLTFFINPRPTEEVLQILNRLSKSNENITLFVAGNSLLFPENKYDFKNTFFLSGASSLIKFLE